MKVLVFGSSGYCASNILEIFSKFSLVADNFTDISKFSQVLKAVERHKPDWVINGAAVTSEDLCEIDLNYWEKMIKANLLGAINVLKVCHFKKIKLVHLRTPFENFVIDDYSLSKLSAYKFIGAEKYKEIVLSVVPGWFFGSSKSRQFDALLIRSIKEKIPLGITNNSICTPVFMKDFCLELEKLILKNEIGNHVISGKENCTRYEFAKCVANSLGKTMDELKWTENNNFKEEARRPKDWSNIGNLPSYKERIDDFLKENNLK